MHMKVQGRLMQVRFIETHQISERFFFNGLRIKQIFMFFTGMDLHWIRWSVLDTFDTLEWQKEI